MNMLGAVWAKVLQLIDLAAKVIVVGVPVLYFMGWSYLEKYWEQFGVSDTLLGLSTPDYVRSGAIVLMVSLLELSPWVLRLAVASVVLISALVVARIFFLPNLFSVHRGVRTAQTAQKKDAGKRLLPKYRQLARTLDGLVDTVAAGSVSFLIPFMFLVALIVAGIKPSQAMAEKDAAEKLKSVSNAAVEEASWLIAHSDEAAGRPSLVVQCGGEVCVVLTGDRTEVWPRSSITRMETCRRVGKADDGTFHCINRMKIL
jgi:hypothetical protein